MFRGLTTINLDPKSRIGIPAKHRENIKQSSNNCMVLTIDTDAKCLLLYPQTEWEVIEKKIYELPTFEEYTRRIQRLLIGHATDVEMDKQGRIIIPPLLKEYAELEKSLILVGQGKKFEVWSEVNWHTQREVWIEGNHPKGDMPDVLKDLAL